MRIRRPALALGAGLLVVGAATTVVPAANATPHALPHATALHRVLFDDTLAETAGNADWIISTSMPDPTQENPNPQKETDWTGAISSWGVALQQTGQYKLDTLPPGNTITFGTSNALDLSNFDVLVLPEPNVLLSSAEKTAVMTFVQDGGGLFVVDDHNGSDRNNDGADSVAVTNDLMTSNGVDDNDPFGISVDKTDISSDHPVAVNLPGNPVLNGTFGTVHHSLIADGTTYTLHPSDNANATGLLYLSTATPGGTTNATFVTSTFGKGRVAMWDDSSAIDDGTGEPNNNLFVGWADPTADNAALGLNATAWLAQGSGGTGGGGAVSVSNPGNQSTVVGTAVTLPIAASDTAGGTLSYSAAGLPAGLSINASTGVITGTPTTAATNSVTVTATDSTGPSGTTSFTWTVTSGSGGCTAAQLLGNPGFETGTAAPWTATPKVIADQPKQPPHSGTWDAWLDGYGVTHTDTLAQTVAIPSGCTSADFTFWLHIDTAETGTKAFDTLTLQVLNSSGSVLSTPATFSNVDAANGYSQRSVDLAQFAGQTVTVQFTGTEDNQQQTSFVIDDTALTVS